MSDVAKFCSRFSCQSRWSNQRIAFGKPLHTQAVVRAKLAGMISRVESSQNWLESVTYQMNNVSSQFVHCKQRPTFSVQMSYDEQSDKLAGTIALLKQFVPSCTPPQAGAHTFVDTSRAQAEKLLKMLHRFLVGGRSRFRGWAA